MGVHHPRSRAILCVSLDALEQSAAREHISASCMYVCSIIMLSRVLTRRSRLENLVALAPTHLIRWHARGAEVRIVKSVSARTQDREGRFGGQYTLDAKSALLWHLPLSWAAKASSGARRPNGNPPGVGPSRGGENAQYRDTSKPCAWLEKHEGVITTPAAAAVERCLLLRG